ncbi:hypothetical protein GSF04_02885 [Pseudoalteromonas sp. A22]|uniref:hypothetical protein n=1 Tax=Pseudoalteromonas sp. A22 TaxID=327511 RepID=UPI001BA44CDB|nr:hypothetical protein [Pseudoalteromonas sp. A22]QUI61487.1 hypothetical protein GSF04_02885 [Pseudoalteromonas sp. A22]
MSKLIVFKICLNHPQLRLLNTLMNGGIGKEKIKEKIRRKISDTHKEKISDIYGRSVACSGQLIPDSELSFSSATAGACISLCVLAQT